MPKIDLKDFVVLAELLEFMKTPRTREEIEQRFLKKDE
jgi:hypothetical protein